MQKVLIDVTQHPSARPAVKKRALQPLWVTPALRGGDGRVRDGDLEEDGCFFEVSYASPTLTNISIYGSFVHDLGQCAIALSQLENAVPRVLEPLTP